MLTIREAIVVEGRYDKNTLSQVVDTLILETNGFGIFKDPERMSLLRRAAERDMEIACDAAVLAGRDGEWRRRYGAALLSFVPVGRPAPLTSQFAGGARGLKERFRALMDASAKRPGRPAPGAVRRPAGRPPGGLPVPRAGGELA